MSELKACPFCSNDKLKRVSPKGEWVECPSCRASALIVHWNTRTPDPAMQKVVDAAREVAKAHKSGHAVMCHHTDTGEFVCALCEALSDIKEK